MATPRFTSPNAPRQRKITACMAWLQEAMAGYQERPAKEVEAEGRACGFSHGVIQTARERLHIESRRRDNAWYWIQPKKRAPRQQKKQPVIV